MEYSKSWEANVSMKNCDSYNINKSNPIFDQVKPNLDTYLFQKNISEEDIDGEFYVDARMGDNPTNEQIMRLWAAPEEITSYNSLKGKIVNSGLVYLLLGRKGTGKSTLLVHFLNEEKEKRNKLIPIYLDLKSKKTDAVFRRDVHNEIRKLIIDIIREKELAGFEYFSPEKMEELSPFYKGISADEKYNIISNKKDELLGFFFSRMKSDGNIVYVVFDNIDDWPRRDVQAIIDIATEFKDRYHTYCIIALRDYWTPRNLRLTDHQYASYFLRNPDFNEIIKKRLDLSISNPNPNNKVTYELSSVKFELGSQEIINIFKDLSNKIHSNNSLQNFIFNASNCNLREYIKWIYYFFHSIRLCANNTFARLLAIKINELLPKDDRIEMPEDTPIFIYDFIEHNMAIHSLCYDLRSSIIFNVSHHNYQYPNGEEFRSSLIFIRILQNSYRDHATTKSCIIQDLTKIGYPEDGTKGALAILLENEFIESPEGVQVDDITEFYLSNKGYTYLSDIIPEYRYLLYISDVVPMPNMYRISIDEKFGQDPYERGSLGKQIASVEKLLDFLEYAEGMEEDNCSQKDILKRYKDDYLKRIRREVNETIKKLNSYNPYSVFDKLRKDKKILRQIKVSL
jgi:hypothetical protein